MKLDDILPIERNRKERENWNKIFLIKSNPVAGLYEATILTGTTLIMRSV